MPDFLRRFADRIERKDTVPLNRYEGFTGRGEIVMRDRRGTLKAELPTVETKSSTLSDSMAIYRPSGGKIIDAAKAMGSFNNWAYAAVNAIGREISNIEWRLYEINGEEHEEVDDHEVLDLLDCPNPYQTGIEFKYTMMSHLELAGNFYGLLEGVRNERDKPKAIHPLNPGRVRVKLNKTRFPYTIDHYEFTIDGNRYKFKPYEILHLKYPDPNDPFVGIGIPQTIPVWIDADNYALEYNRKFFINGAQVGLYLETETNVEGNIDRIKRSMRDEYGGVQNAHKIPVLPKGAKLQHTGVTQRDMDFAKLADATRDRILAGFGVSKTILGTAESDTNRATAETADYVFSKRTIKPKMLLVVSYLNAFLVSRYADNLYLTFIDPTPEDKQFRTQEMQAAVGNQPIMTQNEARRQYLGLGPVEGGDQLMHPTSMEPVGATEQPEGDDITPNLAKTAEGWRAKRMRVRTGGKTSFSNIGRIRAALMQRFQNALAEKTDFQVKSVKDLTHSEYMEHWKRFADRSEFAEAELLKVFKGINKKQREDVLENLPSATGITKALDELFDLKEWIGITINLATPILTSLTRDEAAA